MLPSAKGSGADNSDSSWRVYHAGLLWPRGQYGEMGFSELLGVYVALRVVSCPLR